MVVSLDKFRHYLVGHKVLIFTNDVAIKYLLKKSMERHRLTRWTLLLQDFHFDIIDKRDSKNVIVDHLSRIDPSVLEKVEFDSSF